MRWPPSSPTPMLAGRPSPASASAPSRGSSFPAATTATRCAAGAGAAGATWRGCSQQGLNTSRLPHLGYFEEQLLSSSLFRLYRSIGGDDSPPETRHSASDYCVYLVMHAIQLLGAQPAVPAYQIEAFVDALIDADIGAGRVGHRRQLAGGLRRRPRDVHRVGGCVHKVIRWAFERQGLYANVADRRSRGSGQAAACGHLHRRSPARRGGRL